MPQFSDWDIGKELMPRDNAIRFARSAMPDLVQRACAEGWQQQLIGFIQRRHCKPTGEQVQAMIRDHNEFDLRFSQMSPEMQERWKLKDIAAKREATKADLLKPLQLKATG
ncbi:hypothetical protein [uncultured Roseibium sp.]|uniref:hypothetical protein n=1 Tax=uncultured Roseibium sp. TaxID=1936171 RepID=UPI0026033B0D|nr:hypothetical protein [uncultured Roseibium sp.]